ncbi:MAG: hypothetical protein MJE68_09800 [Proteobacteria bacterium]|nr:hypothetical protein [Pseudomonadota bacterium]
MAWLGRRVSGARHADYRQLQLWTRFRSQGRVCRQGCPLSKMWATVAG